MPLTDADKDTMVLLNEIKTFIVNPTYLAKVNELLSREILENDVDDSSQHRGGSRPKHQPLNP